MDLDWVPLLAELQEAGVTQTEIARRAGLKSSSPVSDLARGETQNPGYRLGRVIEDIYEATFKRTARSKHAKPTEGTLPTLPTLPTPPTVAAAEAAEALAQAQRAEERRQTSTAEYLGAVGVGRTLGRREEDAHEGPSAAPEH